MAFPEFLVLLLALYPAAEGPPVEVFAETPGVRVAVAGDVDGDGVDDVLVSVAGPPAAVDLRSGRDGGAIRRFLAPAEDAGFGAALAGEADLDGDGVPDVVIGAPGAAGAAGAVHAFSARGGLLWTAGGRPGERLGSVLAPAGDLDRDGIGDVAGGRRGGVRILSGRTGASCAEWPLAGRVLALAGGADLDGDGVADLVVGLDSGPRAASAGHVAVLSGASGSVRWIIDGSPGAGAGRAVAVLADVDGDGRAEVAAGEPGVASVGRVRVFSGRTGAPLWSALGTHERPAFGSALAVLPDVTGDGTADLLAGAPWELAPGGLKTGSVTLLCGQSGTRVARLRGERGGARYGAGVVALRATGRANGWRFVVAAPGSGTVRFHVGRARGPGDVRLGSAGAVSKGAVRRP